MTEPQIWTALVILAVALAGMISLTVRTMTVQFDSLGHRIGSVEATMNTRFGAVEATVNTRFEAVEATMNARFAAVEGTMNARFETINTKIDGLDRDVQALSVKVFGDD